MRTLVLNGWAAGREAWDLCTFDHDWVFSYLEQLDGLPERVIESFEAVTLVGWSMGGSGALRLALAYPEKVRALVLVAATPRMMAEPETGWKGLSPRRLQALRLGTRLAFAGDPGAVYDEAAMERGLAYLEATDLRAALAARTWSIPVAILQSERDGIVQPQNAAFLHGIFPGSTVRMIPGGEHALPVTAPEAIDAAVAEVQMAIGGSTYKFLPEGARKMV